MAFDVAIVVSGMTCWYFGLLEMHIVKLSDFEWPFLGAALPSSRAVQSQLSAGGDLLWQLLCELRKKKSAFLLLGIKVFVLVIGCSL